MKGQPSEISIMAWELIDSKIATSVHPPSAPRFSRCDRSVDEGTRWAIRSALRLTQAVLLLSPLQCIHDAIHPLYAPFLEG